MDPKLVPKDAVAPSPSATRSLSKLSLSASSDGTAPSASTALTEGGEEPSKDVLGDLLDAPMDAEGEEAQAKILAKLEGKQDSDVEAFYRHARAKAMRFRPTLLPPPPPPIDFQTYFLPEASASSAAPLSRASTPAPAAHPPPTPGPGEAPYVHVGRPIVQKEVTQGVKATLWMSTSFPLFVEQLFPMMTIMSPTNEHFARFKDFIDLKLPRGFPVKVGTCAVCGPRAARR